MTQVSMTQDTDGIISGMQKGLHHDFFCHLMQLTPGLASHDASGIVNGTPAFQKTIKMRHNMTCLVM